MGVAYRGVVVDGEVWAWPTVLWDHNEAFQKLSWLEDYSARWRQWSADDPPDFDKGASPQDRELVEQWLRLS